MPFNPDPRKPAQEVLFSRKKKVQIHPTISLNNIQIEIASHRKYLDIYLMKSSISSNISILLL